MTREGGPTLGCFIPTVTRGGCAKAVTRIVQPVGGADTAIAIDRATREVRIPAARSSEPIVREALARAGYPGDLCGEAAPLG